MKRTTAILLAAAGLSALPAHDGAAQRRGRVDVPRVHVEVQPVNVTVPAISVSVPRIRVDNDVRVDIPPIHVNIPEIPINVPAMSFDWDGLRIDLSHIGAEIQNAIDDAMADLDQHHRRYRYDHPDSFTSDVTRIQKLRREWRKAMRTAETNGEWEQVDELARQLTRAAERLKRDP